MRQDERGTVSTSTQEADNPPVDEDPWLSTRQVAQLLGISVWTVRKAVRLGILGAEKRISRFRGEATRQGRLRIRRSSALTWDNRGTDPVRLGNGSEKT